MPSGLHRSYGAHHLHFITCSCYHRLPFQTPARRLSFNVWTTKRRIEKLRYMHRNPVRRGLAAQPDQWAWSSFRFYGYAEKGRVTVNAIGSAKMKLRPPPHERSPSTHPFAQNAKRVGTQACNSTRKGGPSASHSYWARAL